MGRYSRWPLIESALKIDIRDLGRAAPGSPRGVFSPRIRSVDVTLGYSSGAGIALQFHFGETYSYMRLLYHTNDLGSWAENIRVPEAVDETITMRRFAQPFGGHRWYFICPAANRQCQVLYLPYGAGRFRSRWGFRCPRLQYQSQRLSTPWRLKHRAEQIGKRVLRKGPAEFRQEFADYSFPPKPPWMRWRTYNRLDELSQDFDTAGEAALDVRLIRWARRRGMKGMDDLYDLALDKKK